MTNPNAESDIEIVSNLNSDSGRETKTELDVETKAEVETNTHLDVGDQSFFQSLVRTAREISRKIDALGVETRGIQRIEPYEREHQSSGQLLHIIGLWLSASGGLSSMSSYFLGPIIYELEFRQALTCGLISMWIGCFFAAYLATMGPQSGCRQLVTARYLFGWWLVKFVGLIAIIGGMGWSVVNCVVGGEMLAAISDGKIPIWIGIIIVTLVSFFVAIFGIKHVLKAETLFSIPVLTSFLLLYISASDKFKYANDYKNDFLDSRTYTGNYLSFFSLCYSITSTWGSVTADYYILFPEDTPKMQVFMITFLGIGIPATFVGVLGLLLASCAMSYQPWMDLYDSYGMGGLLHAGFERWGGFGKFCVVILVLSLISNNILNTYSAAFSIQLAGEILFKVPRWFWAIACTVFYFVCALVGRNSFSDILGNFLPMIGYWVSLYFILQVEENLIFRSFFHHLYTKEFPNVTKPAQRWSLKNIPKRTHNWNNWNDPNVITRGLAATAAFWIGVVGAVMGMCQTYYVGPISSKIGDNGGDIGSWLGMAFACVVYPPLRYLELKKFGR